MDFFALNTVTLLAIIIAFLVFLYRYFSKNATYWSDRGVKGPKPVFLFGNILDNFKTPINLLEVDRMKQFGRVHGFFEFTQPLLTVGDPELLKQMTVKDFHIFMNNLNLLPGDPLFSKMLGNLCDDDWRRVRTIVSGTFTTNKIKRMTPFIEECTRNALTKFDEIAEKGEEIGLKKVFGAFTLDVIAKCAFAANTNAHEGDSDNKFVKNTETFLNFSSLRILLFQILPIRIQRAINFQVVPKECLGFFVDAIKFILKQRKKETKSQASQHKDFLQLLVDAEMNSEQIEGELMNALLDSQGNIVKSVKNWQKKLDEDEIVAQCILFLIAGIETTSTLLTFCSYALTMHPEIQHKLYSEINDYFKEHENAEYESLNQLKYLDAVINETLRHYPPLVQLHRMTNADYKLKDAKIVIPKGTIINLPFYAIHHDEEFFPNPYVFDPSRFLPENRHLIKPYTFLAFGIGPRQCVGMRFAYYETKLFLANVVRRFKFVRTERTVESPNFISKKITLKCDPIYLKLEKR